MNISIDDCDARIFLYYEDFNGIVEDNGLQGLIGSEEAPACCELEIPATSHVNAVSIASGTAAPPPPRPPRAPPHDGCLVCKGAHWLNNAHGYAARRGTEAISRANQKRSRTRLKTARSITPAGSVQINVLLEVRYMPDTVADKSIVPQNIIDSLFAVQTMLSVMPLSTPVVLEMADGRQLKYTKEVPLDLELSTISKPVGLGIDVEMQLAQLAGPSLLDGETDEFPVGDEISNMQQSQNATDSISTVAQLLDRAVENGCLPSMLPIDYRTVTKVIVPIAGTMPPVATTLTIFEGMKVFGRFDFTQGFWQRPLHKDSREVFSFVTPDVVYTPMRVSQGTMNSALRFQSQVQTKLAPLIPKSALVWVDGVILFAPTIHEFLNVPQVFFELIHEANFKLDATKSLLFELEIKWCRRLISSAGIRHDPLPSCPSLPQLLSSNTSAVVNLIRDSALMAFPDPDAEMLFLTDATAVGYSIIVTQFRIWDALLPVDKQQHEMIVCKGGLFKHSEENWSVVEKEAFPIVNACYG
ncbi:unnamed protein product [Phytophthora lilii]|uniref:Unnamed protein product n=1 Tax=Phytophthora lilii TaxID=2077276 RepID=A0A9W6U749_9STRA|nr:unnamed protein product [Phytophthora lilii]